MSTKIEWTEATWNPVSGCTKISEGCKNCYAEKMANRLKAMGTKGYENGFAVTLHRDKLDEPLKRKKPTMYFVCSMGDLFHEDVPFEFIDSIWAVMAAAGQHTFQILTKRPDRMKEYLSQQKYSSNSLGIAIARIAGNKKTKDFLKPLPNVWLGVTAENQEQADKRIPILLDTPAALRFVSVEPMIGGINLEIGENEHIKLDWVIVGGETGTGARPLRYEWVKDIQGQCEAANVPFFFKKWGKTAYQYGKVMNIAPASVLDGVIDGVEYRQMPEATK